MTGILQMAISEMFSVLSFLLSYIIVCMVGSTGPSAIRIYEIPSILTDLCLLLVYSTEEGRPMEGVLTISKAVESFFLMAVLGGSGPSLKWVSLAALVVQNSALVLLMKQSLTVQSPGGSRYAPASAVLVAECIKLAVCVGLHMLTLSKTGELSLEKVCAWLSVCIRPTYKPIGRCMAMS